MEIKREIYDKMKDWKEKSAGRTALMIEGARRIGKSTIAEKFGKENYKSYILIDFGAVTKRIKDNFYENLSDLDRFYQVISLHCGVRLYRHESLLIFDEIQKFPRAREALKYLVKDGRYDFMETGSLISIKENVNDIIIPSEERKLKMHPVTFYEYMNAAGEDVLLDYIKDCHAKSVPLGRDEHKKAMLLFNEYMLVGGMPQSIVAYLDNGRDFESADEAKRDIIALYRDDIKKASKRYNSKVSALFDNIPGYLSRHDKKVVLSNVDENGKFTNYDEPLFWLGDSMICNLCYKCNDPNIGLSLNMDDSSVKCYMADTGLLVSLAFSENDIVQNRLYQNILDGRLSLNKGMLYENAIAQMLVAGGHRLFFYSHYNSESKHNDIEVDFLVTNGAKTDMKVFPIEVKSSKNYTTTSYNLFRKKFGKRISTSFIVHPKEYANTADGVKLPPYMFPLIPEGQEG